MDNKAIGCYLLNKRKELGKTQKEIADEFGVTYQAVSRWENGDSIPDIETLGLLADYYDVSIDEILQRETKQKETLIVNGKETKFDNAGFIWIMAVMSLMIYLFALGSFYILDELVIKNHILALIVYGVFALGGLIPINAYFVTDAFIPGHKRTKNIYIAYVVSYIPLIVFTVLVLL
jgi:transcriptional regulator with XRE-family HTH domain